MTYEVLFKAQPYYDHIKVFGSLCYVHKNQRQKDKFQLVLDGAFLWLPLWKERMESL